MKKSRSKKFNPSEWAKPILAPCPPEKFREILGNHFAGTPQEKEFTAMVRAIETRAADDTLRVAVIGEFSSGKSTFINALMKQRLLKTASDATTAAGTHIRSGKTFSLSVTMTGGRAMQRHVSTQIGKWERLSNAKKREELPKILAHFSADESIAENVARIDLSVPFDFRIPELEIIDTPGFNSGEAKGKRHCALSSKIAKDYADCGIVIIPATQAGSAELLDFLKANVGAYLKECVFVRSQSDKLDEEEELDKSVERMRKLLQKKLSLKKLPDVFPVNSQIELRSDSPELAPWRDRFAALEDALRERMTRNRSRLLGKRLKSLCAALRDSLAAELARRKSEIDKEKRFLARNKISRIEDATQELLGNVISELNELVKEFSDAMQRIRDNAESDAESEARTTIARKVRSDFLTLRGEIEELLKRVLADGKERFLGNLNVELASIFREISPIRNRFLKDFEKHYADFPALNHPFEIPKTRTEEILVDFEFDSESDSSGMDILDLAVDRLFWNSAKSIGRYEEMYLPQISQYFDALHEKACEYFNEKITPKIVEEFEALAAAHMRSYSKAVGKLLAEREARLEELREQSSLIRDDSNFLKNAKFETTKTKKI